MDMPPIGRLGLLLVDFELPVVVDFAAEVPVCFPEGVGVVSTDRRLPGTALIVTLVGDTSFSSRRRCICIVPSSLRSGDQAKVTTERKLVASKAFDKCIAKMNSKGQGSSSTGASICDSRGQGHRLDAIVSLWWQRVVVRRWKGLKIRSLVSSERISDRHGMFSPTVKDHELKVNVW